MAYEAGIESDPSSDICKKGLAEVKRAMDTDSESPFSPGGDMGLGKMFNDPQMVRKLENHPKTGPMMKDPAFAAKIRQMQAGGGKGDIQGMLADPRMLTVLGVLMGIDIVSILNYAKAADEGLECHGEAGGFERNAVRYEARPSFVLQFRTLVCV